MDPYSVIWVGFGGKRFGKALVDGLICAPFLVGIEVYLVQGVMKQWPKNAVREAVVIPFHFCWAQMNGTQPPCGQLSGDRGTTFGMGARNVTQPAEPQPVTGVVCGLEGCC